MLPLSNDANLEKLLRIRFCGGHSLNSLPQNLADDFANGSRLCILSYNGRQGKELIIAQHPSLLVKYSALDT